MSEETPQWLNPAALVDSAWQANSHQIRQAILADEPGPREFARMCSPKAQEHLELMAQRAQLITRRHFGRTTTLYAPLYLSNYCSGGCLYCGFASDRKEERCLLSQDEMRAEMEAMKAMGLEEILLLTGERMPQADLDYLETAVRIAAEYFSSITIEVFPMEEHEYRRLADAGCTGVTLYQESYDAEVYKKMHRWGPKRDYTARLDAPSRALQGGLRTAGLGALLGLAEPTGEMIALYQHARHLLRTFWQAGVTLSFPRIRPQTGGFQPDFPVSETMLAQYIFAFRIALPDVPLVLSTRESAATRDGLAGLGISKMSVASKTTVGGYSNDNDHGSEQFAISDNRDIPTFSAMLRAKGLVPIFKNWDAAYRETANYLLHDGPATPNRA
jgi:2-iminoacetate synthase